MRELLANLAARLRTLLGSPRASAAGSTTALTLMSPELIKWFGGSTLSGKSVNDQAAMGLSPAWACRRILAESVGSIPWAVYRKKGDDAERADDHPLSLLLNGRPNADMTPAEMKETIVYGLGGAGNSYNYLERLGGQVVSAYPLPPVCVQPMRKRGANTRLQLQEGEVFFRYLDRGRYEDYPREKIWQVKGFGGDPLAGLSPIGVVREAFGFALATEEFGAKFFAQGAMPSGFVTTEKTLDSDKRQTVRDALQMMVGGLGNMHRFALFEGGMKPEPWGGMTLEDMAYILIRKLNVQDMSRIYRVPLHMLAELEKGASFASIEQFSLEFLMYTLMPYFTRIEASAGRWLLAPKDQGKFYLRFNYEAFLRADSKARAEYLGLMVNNGLMSRNEGRAKENMNRADVKGMDDFTVQTALAPIDTLRQKALSAPPKPAADPAAA